MFKSMKTVALLGLLSGLLLWIGSMFEGGLYIAVVIALAMNGGTYWFSDKLAIKMARAKPADEAAYPWYHQMVRALSQRAGQPTPALYVSPSPQPNAFATGRNPRNGVVCINQGLIDLLDYEEMEGVLAHELSHVYNRDILIGTIAATIATAVTFLARFALFFGGRDGEGNPFAQIALVLLTPIAAMLIQFAVTRSRETQADASGAELSGKPLALASALRKLESGGKQLARRGVGGTPAEQPGSAFSSLYISAPFGGAGRGGGLSSAFRTHPRTEDRVANLERIARRMGQMA